MRHDVKNGIAVHAWTKQHKVDWHAATVKHVETNHTKRKTIRGQTKVELELHVFPAKDQSAYTIAKTLVEKAITRLLTTLSNCP